MPMENKLGLQEERNAAILEIKLQEENARLREIVSEIIKASEPMLDALKKCPIDDPGRGGMLIELQYDTWEFFKYQIKRAKAALEETK